MPKAEYDVYASLHEESNFPWVWITEPPLRSRSIIQIDSGKNTHVVCQCRIIDDNFRKLYDARPTTNGLSNDKAIMVISDWYRGKLHIKPGETVDLTITKITGPRAMFCLYYHHPDTVVCAAFFISMISLGLGLLSFVLAVLSVFGMMK